MSLIPVVYDFETYWAAGHSITNMSGIEYVCHPDTEIQSCSIQIGFKGEAKTYFGYDDIKEAFDEIDWSNAMAIAHNNSEFDAMILAWRFGIKPKMWACTIAMARPIHTKDVGLSLAKLAAHYNLEAKGSLEEVNTKGKKLADFTPDEINKMEVYNNADTRICANLFRILVKKTPAQELRIIDMTIRMLVEPQIYTNVGLLERGLKAERGRKRKILRQIGVMIDPLLAHSPDDDILADVQSKLKSAPKFKKLLEELGAEVPMKVSPSNPDKKIPALAKNDEAFLAMAEHDDPMVATAVNARLDTQSSILETRMQRFIDLANYCDGKMPIALRYYGADTTGRWSGTMKVNQQNLPRVNPNKANISDVLRKSLVAPPGYKIVVADLSGIELRVNMFLWKVPYATEMFTANPAKADLYKTFASQLYNVPESDVSKQQRQVGKVAHLGLGFGAGATTFQTVAKLMGGVTLDEAESLDVVQKYRRSHIQVAKGWKTCHSALDLINAGMEQEIDPCGLCYTSKEGIHTPRGVIRYPNLRQVLDTKAGKTEWMYGEGRHITRIYAGKVTENIVQHLARNVIADMTVAIASTELGKKYPLAHTVHDELIYVVKDEDAQEMLDTIQSIMRTPPSWWPELATWSEGDIAQNYGDAK